MRLDAHTRLTYCTNVHPGETLAALEHSVLPQVEAVKARFCPDAPFGTGLRLSAAVASELIDRERLQRFRDTLAQAELYAFTLNGFPYGNFHGEPVKTEVYRPDWTEPERSEYTLQLATILAELLPDGERGSISTVPVGFAPRFERAERDRAARALVDVAAALWRVRENSGKHIALALEPEPWCALETTTDALRYFEDHLMTAGARAHLCASTGLPPQRAEAVLRDHLGICLDACHAAVGHEDVHASLDALQRHGLALVKLQVSAGLDVPHVTAAHLQALAAFAEDVYLHQVVVRFAADGSCRKHLDLGEAIRACDPRQPQSWRIHFHVPIFTERLGVFGSTQGFLAELLLAVRQRQMTEHLEVETYTWSVLPAEHRTVPIDIAITRELQWAQDLWRA